MTDLLSRQTIIDIFCSQCAVDKPETCSTIRYGDKWCNEVYTILNAPAVDAVQVVHGHWKEDPSGYGFWICSACGFVSEASAADMLYKFCPVCGAKMDGKDSDGNG